MSSVRKATAAEIAQWDKCLEKNPGPQSFFQETNFLIFKSQQHISPWQIRYLVHTVHSQEVYVGYLVKYILGLGEFWYAPGGPQLHSVNQVSEVIGQLKEFAPKAFTVLLEPTILVNSKESQERTIQQLDGAQYTLPVQPNVHTVIVPLQDESKIFAGFKQRTRRAIRQAEKAGVTVNKMPYTNKTKDVFFEMYTQTAARAGFFIRERDYYMAFWDAYHKTGQGDFFFAYGEDGKQPIAGAFILYDHKKALYKDGASIRNGLPSGTLHFLHWEIIKWLEKKGLKEYDLHGVPPSWLQDDKKHRQYGLGIFKSSFGNTIDYVGAVQWHFKPLQAALWNKGIKKVYYTLNSRRGGFFF